MPKMIGINIGFITNSSSVVHHFPAALLNDPQIKMFIEAMEIQNGFIGDDLWHRGECASFAVSKEQKAKLAHALSPEGNGYEARGPGVDVDGDYVVVVYGDEYPGLAMTLSDMFKQAAKRAGMPEGYGQDYN